MAYMGKQLNYVPICTYFWLTAGILVQQLQNTSNTLIASIQGICLQYVLLSLSCGVGKVLL